MKIELSKEQYQSLLELIYLGNWIVNSIKVEVDPKTQKYDELESYLFFNAKEFGLAEWCDGEEKSDCFPSAEFEEKSSVFDYIDKYDDYTFWEEFSHRLARRDLIRKYGEEGFMKMAFEERITKEDELICKYDKIFYEAGLNAVKVTGVND